MATKTVKVTIEGISALLMHKFPMEPVAAMEKKTAAEQAEYAAYRDPDNDGKLYLPGIAVQRALISAAVFSKGKGRASLQKPVAACVQVDPERIPLGVKDYNIDSRPVVIPATKGRIMRHRPRLDEWKASFTIEFDDELVTAIQLRTIVDDMGKRVGLLDFRPERKGSFGRCAVTKWTPAK